MLGLRTAGKALADFDEAYANRAYDDMAGRPLAQALGGTPLRGPYEFTKGASFGEALAERALVGSMAAANVGYRYGLPAAGLTLAGKALYDLTQDYQTSGTISL